ncbi:hypothetical protein HY095_03360 [Candidatus Micrarchaeota archaeon]|nr:hypothetical protein [Candidatus Micrarchaeota archaeon]
MEVKKGKSSTPAIIGLVLVAALAAVFVYAANSPSYREMTFGKNQAMKNAEQFNSTGGATLLHYKDSDYGFTAAYPAGYSIERDLYTYNDSTAIVIRGGVGDLVESYEIRTLPQSVSADDFAQIASSYGKDEIELQQETAIGGKQAFLLYQHTPNIEGLGPFYGRQAFINGCKTPDGREYSIAVTEAVPEALLPDLPLANLIMQSVKC